MRAAPNSKGSSDLDGDRKANLTAQNKPLIPEHKSQEDAIAQKNLLVIIIQ
jgi:hypothetical protein